MSSWHSPQSIYHVGHRLTTEMLKGPLYAEEKIDGSFFAFGVYDGELKIRSKSATLYPDAPPKMFERAINTVLSIQDRLQPGLQYRGEVLDRPKHNTLAYDRVPTGHIILFDVCTGEESYLEPDQKANEARRLGLECVPVLYRGFFTADKVRELLKTTSVLGGQLIEGVVLKPEPGHEQYAPDHKVIFAKYVSEVFKEIHGGEWKKNNPGRRDIIDALIGTYSTPARWQKAIQHLAEQGKLEGSPKDIGLLVREIPADVFADAEHEMKEAVWHWAKPQIQRGLIKGFPEFYKARLLEQSFEEQHESETESPRREDDQAAVQLPAG